ncbi:hypothetical protein NBRC3299_2079 [Acetobacter pasteurianus NBRC 3299]|nr:hypothetical protein NBRC3299_2079 [Acetobacter pasteurianus NBRC 3299]
MPSSLDAQTISIIKACVPALEAHGLDITREMYKRLLSNPDIRRGFLLWLPSVMQEFSDQY